MQVLRIVQPIKSGAEQHIPAHPGQPLLVAIEETQYALPTYQYLEMKSRYDDDSSQAFDPW